VGLAFADNGGIMKKHLIWVPIILICGFVYGDDITTRIGLTVPSIGSAGYAPKINNNLSLIDSKTAVLDKTNTFTGTNNFSGAVTFGAALPTLYGGTGQNWSSVAIGRIPYFSGTGILTTLPAGTTNYLFQSGGNDAPSWVDPLSLTCGYVTNGVYTSGSYADPSWITSLSASKISGTVFVSSNIAGGVLGSIPYQSAINTTVLLSTGSEGQVLTAHGSAAPTWETPSGGSISIGSGVGGSNPNEGLYVDENELLASTGTFKVYGSSVSIYNLVVDNGTGTATSIRGAGLNLNSGIWFNPVSMFGQATVFESNGEEIARMDGYGLHMGSGNMVNIAGDGSLYCKDIRMGAYGSGGADADSAIEVGAGSNDYPPIIGYDWDTGISFREGSQAITMEFMDGEGYFHAGATFTVTGLEVPGITSTSGLQGLSLTLTGESPSFSLTDTLDGRSFALYGNSFQFTDSTGTSLLFDGTRETGGVFSLAGDNHYPSFSFLDGQQTGLYLAGTDLGITVGEVAVATFTGTGLSVSNINMESDGVSELYIADVAGEGYINIDRAQIEIAKDSAVTLRIDSDGLNGGIYASSGSANYPSYRFLNSEGTGLFLDTSGPKLGITVDGGSPINFTDTLVTVTQDLQVDGISELDGGVVISTSAGAPVGASTAYSVIYSTGASSAEMWVMDGAGNNTQISPHNRETGRWQYFSCNENSGRCYQVPDMEKLISIVEKLSGEKLHEEWNQKK
jgi:hypothetical protein